MFIEINERINLAFSNSPESNFVVIGGLECSVGKLRQLVDALRSEDREKDYTIIRQQDTYSLLVSKILPPRIVVEKIENAEFIY